MDGEKQLRMVKSSLPRQRHQQVRRVHHDQADEERAQVRRGADPAAVVADDARHLDEHLQDCAGVLPEPFVLYDKIVI